jgi:hypothetical protein
MDKFLWKAALFALCDSYIFDCGPCQCSPLGGGGFSANCTGTPELDHVPLESFSEAVSQGLMMVDMRGTALCSSKKLLEEQDVEVLCNEVHKSGGNLEATEAAPEIHYADVAGVATGAVALCLVVLVGVVLGIALYRVSFSFSLFVIILFGTISGAVHISFFKSHKLLQSIKSFLIFVLFFQRDIELRRLMVQAVNDGADAFIDGEGAARLREL